MTGAATHLANRPSLNPKLEGTMHVATAAAVGLGVGVHAATWGMFKDSPHEGFYWTRFVRSPVIGLLAALALSALLPWPPGVAGAVLLFGAAYAAERFILETWKTFFRTEDQSKYTIPMQLAVFGRPVQSASLRAVLGTLYFSGGFGVLLLAGWVGAHAPLSAPLLAIVLVGSAGGWISAFGGAWKDAPIEGFETFKFFRSPSVALAYSLLLSRLTTDAGVIMLGATGLTVATLETWKKFSRPLETVGKFSGKPILFPYMMQRRYRFVPLYVAICGLVAVSLLGAVYASRPGACDGCKSATLLVTPVSERAP